MQWYALIVDLKIDHELLLLTIEKGDATEACGGPNRLTLFSGPTPVGPFVNPGVNGFRSLGCYRCVDLLLDLVHGFIWQPSTL